MTSDAAHLLTDLLQQVSRSFYTTLRILPAPVRRQIGLAYLLARATDTIADTGIVSVSQRLDALQLLRGHILGERRGPVDFGELARHQGSPGERALLQRVTEAIDLLDGFSEADRQLIREVLRTITSGQELDLQRFAQASPENILILGTDPDLDDYTYRVAGCVGEFWTRICRAHLFPHAAVDDATLLANGIRFGKGLQLVNILRDLPSDLRQGRCYMPADRLNAIGLKPTDLLNPANEGRFRPLYNSYLDVAQAHLAAGWEYTLALPRSCIRLRLACAWPVLIGVRTLALLHERNVLDPAHRIKVSRAEVQGMIVRSVLCYPFAGMWGNLFARTGSRRT